MILSPALNPLTTFFDRELDFNLASNAERKKQRNKLSLFRAFHELIAVYRFNGRSC